MYQNQLRSRDTHISVIPLPPLLIFILILLLTPPHCRADVTGSAPLYVINNLHLQVAEATCHDTLYPDLCVSTLSSFPDLTTKSIPQLIAANVNRTIEAVQLSASNCSGIRRQLPKLDLRQKRALDDCLELFDESLAELHTCISDLAPQKSASKHYHDLQTFLSASITNQYTCLDGLTTGDGKVKKLIKARLDYIMQMVSNSLVMLKKIPTADANEAGREKKALSGYGELVGGFPSWLSKKDRRLLQASVNNMTVNLVVAKDGSGNFTTISDAVAAAPNGTTGSRFVVYIKAGAYFENVEVIKKKTNVVFIGDGIGKTVVKASRNVVDGWTTFRSATVGS